MNPGSFCKRLFCWVFVIHTAIKPKHSFCSRTSFHSRHVSYEICTCPCRDYTPKHENCFATLISVCNFHISLQFWYQFAILTFWCIVPTWTFAIFIWVCNFHMSLQFSYQFAFSCHDSSTYWHGFAWILCHYSLELINSTSAMVLRGRQDKLDLSKIDYYLLFKSS
jgi:hypothetical protein